VLIHYEPQAQKSLRYATPLKDAQGTLGEHFGESPYFALVEIDLQEMKLARQEIVAKGKGLNVAQFLLTYKPDVILAKESLSGKGPGYAFAEAGVETSQTEAKTLEELVNGLLEARGGNAAYNH
jgi:predicted Fe-Mo cluster-binding NifX family protein